MKQKDLTLLAVVVIFSVVLAFLLSSVVFGSPKKHQTKVAVVEKIIAHFPDTKNDPAYQKFFNGQAVNLTVLIQVDGPSNNQAPIGAPTAR